MELKSDNNNKRHKLESKEVLIEEEDSSLISMDRLSMLPDSILTEILSYVPLHCAVATSVLSRRWRNVWTQLIHLSFNLFENRRRQQWKPYLEALNLLFSQFTSPKIHTLRVAMPFGVENCQALLSSVGSWITSVCSRHVEQIEVTVSDWYEYGCLFSLPSCLFQCQSLSILKLKGIVLRFEVGFLVNLPNLKRLVLDTDVLDSVFLAQLLMGCPLLEHFSFLGRIKWEGQGEGEGVHCVDLSNLFLKYLHIKLLPSYKEKEKFIINASKLERITLDGLCLGSLSIVEPSGALVTANVSSLKKEPEQEPMDAIDLQFAKMISSATSIHLDFSAFKAITNLKGLLPTFENLSHLKIDFNFNFNFNLPGDWRDLLRLLRFTPKLENLTLRLWSNMTMKWLVPNFEQLPCGFSKLKTIYIDGIKGNKDDFEMIKYILRCTKSLQLLSIRVCIPAKRKDTMLLREYELCQRFFLLESSSSTCKIEFCGCFLTVSSNSFKNGKRHCQVTHLGNLVL